MRAFDPRQRTKPRKSKKLEPMAVIPIVFLLLLFSALLFQSTQNNSPRYQTEPSTNSQNIQTTPKKGTLKNFTGPQFRKLYNNFAYPNTEQINETTPITGNIEADARIKRIAVERGYQLRSAPVTNAFKDVGEGYVLQQRAAKPWLDMVEAAKKDGINIGLTAAFRSSDEQKDIFLQRLVQTGININVIPSGVYDGQLSQVLRTTAIPGYSRHHTGYTVDISCLNQPRNSFEYTVCFEWLKADNYKNAKRFGWIPSYPEGTDKQGPDPESWEYVWVGSDALTE